MLNQVSRGRNSRNRAIAKAVAKIASSEVIMLPSEGIASAILYLKGRAVRMLYITSYKEKFTDCTTTSLSAKAYTAIKQAQEDFKLPATLVASYEDRLAIVAVDDLDSVAMMDDKIFIQGQRGHKAPLHIPVGIMKQFPAVG